MQRGRGSRAETEVAGQRQQDRDRDSRTWRQQGRDRGSRTETEGQ